VSEFSRHEAPRSHEKRENLEKKQKFIHFLLLFPTGKPSRVIHIRNIPNEASDAEVINLGLQFGRVTNVLVLKGKNQAFLEMADEISATAMVSVFNTTPPTVRGRTVYVQFSNHRELKTDQNHSITVMNFSPLGADKRKSSYEFILHYRRQHLVRHYL
jgi:RNA recognition motif-containing protein